MGTADNFAFLKSHDERLVRLGRAAERHFHRDPIVCIIRLRQFAEILAQEVYAALDVEVLVTLRRRLAQAG